MNRAIAGTVLWSAGLVLLASLEKQQDFTLVLAGYALAFGGYVLLAGHPALQQKGYLLLCIGVVGRLIFFPQIPVLSDDIYRFIWDGLLQRDGIPLLAGTPETLMANGTTQGGQYEYLLAAMNSSGYFTIYPPLLQWLFALATLLAGQSIVGFAVVLRTIFLAGDILAAVLLRQLIPKGTSDWGTSWWWFLNPLLIVEGTGNLHAEGLLVAALIGSWWLLTRMKTIQAGAIFALSVLIKLTPLLLLPLIVFNLKGKERLSFLLPIVLLIPAAFLLCFGADVHALSRSLGLYFQHFEFNASFYYLIRGIMTRIVGYNPIQWLGPMLAILTATLILITSWKARKTSQSDLLGAAALAYTIYLIFSTTVHPWYALIPAGLALGSNLQAPLIAWTFLAVFSYSHYWNGANEPNWPWIFAEYLMFFGILIRSWWVRSDISME